MVDNSNVWSEYENVTEQFRNGTLNRRTPSNYSSSSYNSSSNIGSIWDEYENVTNQFRTNNNPVMSTTTTVDRSSSLPEGIRIGRQRELERQKSLPEDASTWDRIKSYVGLPVTDEDYERRNARLLGAADAATLGFSDELYGAGNALIGNSYGESRDKVRNALKNARENNPGDYLYGSIAGTLGTAAIPLGNIAKGAGLARQIGTGARIGAIAGLGGTEADNLKDTIVDTISGAGLGAAGGALGAAGGKALSGTANIIKSGVSRLSDRKNPLRTEEGLNIAFEALKRRSREGYESAKQSGLVLKPEFTSNLKDQVVGYVENKGFNSELQPKIASALRSIDNLGDGEVTITQLDNLRKIVGNISITGDATERMMANRIKNIIDDSLEKASPDQVVSGNINQAITGLKQARKDYSTRARYQDISDAIDNAETRAAVSGQGGNRQNAIRQELRKVLNKSKGFSSDEKKVLKDIVKGTPTTNTLRILGKFSPTTGNLQSTLSAGAGISTLIGALNPAFAIPGAVGLIAKPIAERTLDNNVNTLFRTILNNGQSLNESLPAFTPELQRIIRDYLASGSAIQSREYNR